MAWAFNEPQRAYAPAFTFSGMSANDWLTAATCAGYVNPTILCEPRPFRGCSGEAAWIRHCRGVPAVHLRITGFLINGHAGCLTRESEAMTAAFSPDGAATQAMWMVGENHLAGPMPVALQHHDLCPDNEANIACMQRFRKPGTAQFLDFRMILQGPSLSRSLMNDIRRLYPESAWEVLDPYAFFYLLRHSLGGANTRRATFTFDSMPAAVPSGRTMEVAVGVRNDGWDTWSAEMFGWRRGTVPRWTGRLLPELNSRRGFRPETRPSLREPLSAVLAGRMSAVLRSCLGGRRISRGWESMVGGPSRRGLNESARMTTDARKMSIFSGITLEPSGLLSSEYLESFPPSFLSRGQCKLAAGCFHLWVRAPARSGCAPNRLARRKWKQVKKLSGTRNLPGSFRLSI